MDFSKINNMLNSLNSKIDEVANKVSGSLNNGLSAMDTGINNGLSSMGNAIDNAITKNSNPVPQPIPFDKFDNNNPDLQKLSDSGDMRVNDVVRNPISAVDMNNSVNSNTVVNNIIKEPVNTLESNVRAETAVNDVIRIPVPVENNFANVENSESNNESVISVNLEKGDNL